MVLLGTLVLSAWGGTMSALGRWLHPPEHPFRNTLAADGQVATILGATLVNWDEFPDPLLEVLVERRERAPIIGTAGTRLWSRDREASGSWGGPERWTRLDRLRRGEAIRVPEWDGQKRLCVSWGCIKQIRSAPPPDHLWPGTPRVCGTLKLMRGAYSFASPSAFIHI